MLFSVLFKVLDFESSSVVTVDRLSDLSGLLLAAGYTDDDIHIDFDDDQVG